MSSDKVIDALFNYVIANGINEDGESFEKEYVDNVIERALMGRNPQDRPPADWQFPIHSETDTINLVKNALISAGMITENEFIIVVNRSK